MTEIELPGEPTYIVFPPGVVSAPIVNEFAERWQEAIRTGKPILLEPGWRIHDIAAGKTYEGYPPGWAEPQALLTMPDRFDRGLIVGAGLMALGVVLGYVVGVVL